MSNSDESEFSAIIDEDNFQDRADELDVLAELAGGKKKLMKMRMRRTGISAEEINREGKRGWIPDL